MNTKYIISLIILLIAATACNIVEKEVNKLTGNDEEKIKRLKKEGVKCEALVESVEDMNITVNKDPMVRLSLEVMPPGEPSFGAQVEKLVSRVNVPRKGDYVTVYFNPKDKSDIIVE
ncbi:MAG TPA: hypothetical protein PK605_14880 [Ignavibacteria bacterium]|nr:hypothetical protein [Bacteroidota bacterium]HRE10710.1 hypothetical protein [Ignavibacteria bacterium]HRF66759.1 hypothetical protein [Ignavibacteria bacterium]HRJ05685.1 hypothetical protein [Ignavibacteria bacterium]HRJ86440.1 hypothetical protein [Ignavibacteria bacterium]